MTRKIWSLKALWSFTVDAGNTQGYASGACVIPPRYWLAIGSNHELAIAKAKAIYDATGPWAHGAHPA